MGWITRALLHCVKSLRCSCSRLLIHASDMLRVPFNAPSRRSISKLSSSIKVNDVKWSNLNKLGE